MAPADDFDLDWYVDHVVVPAGIEHRPVGPVRAWQGRWDGFAHGLLAEADGSPTRAAVKHALEQGFVLSLNQARGHGLRDADIRRPVRRGQWTAVGGGVVAVLPRDTEAHAHLDERHAHALAAAAAALRRPRSVVGGASAAVLHGLPLMHVPSHPELAVRHPTTTGLRSDVWIRLAAHPPEEDERWFGAPVAPIPAALGDILRRDPRSGLMAADAALHEKLITAAELEVLRQRLRGPAAAGELLRSSRSPTRASSHRWNR